MSTIKIHTPVHWNDKPVTQKQKNNTWNEWIASNIQTKKITTWFTISLALQCVLFIPLFAALMFYYHAPVSISVITVSFFFANLIGCMGGNGMRTMISIFGLLVIDLFMLATFLI